MKIDLKYITDPKEKLFVKTVLDYHERSEKQNRDLFTDFYNGTWIREVIEKHIGIKNLSNCNFFGGYGEAERQMVGFCSPYSHPPMPPIVCLKVIVKTGIGKPLSHRDFLGALLGLGIERDVVGDIIIKPFGAYIILKSSMADYVSCNLTGIGRYQGIEISEVDSAELEIESPLTKEINTTVASLRADAILAVGFGMSRAACVKLIQADKGTCNGMKTSASSLVKEGDTMSLKGYGKIKLKQINGHTKKDRIHICIEKYI